MQRRWLMLVAVVVVVAAGAVAWFVPDRARPHRIAILDDAPEATRRLFWEQFRSRLRELGYEEGRNAVVEARFAHGSAERLRALVAETVAARPDVVVTVTTGAAVAVKQATSTIPIVAIGPADPVRSGLVASLARPGGNLTGLSPNQAEIAGKWLELALALAPGVRSIVYLTDTANPGEMLVYRDLEQRARAAGIAMQAMDAVDDARVAASFAAMAAQRPDAFIVATSASLVPQRRPIVDGAARLRIPAIYARQEYPQAGGLVSYGADSRALWGQAADYVDRILRGVPPGELPFQMASTYRLVLNEGTARRLAIAVPDAVRARADEVIE